MRLEMDSSTYGSLMTSMETAFTLPFLQEPAPCHDLSPVVRTAGTPLAARVHG